MSQGANLIVGYDTTGNVKRALKCIQDGSTSQGILQVAPVGLAQMLLPAAPIVRPANTTAYAVGDVIAPASLAVADTKREIVNAVAVAGSGGYIAGVSMWTTQISCVARFRLWFFSNNSELDDGGGGTNIDNLPFFIDTGTPDIIGYLDLPAAQSLGGVSWSQNMSVCLPISCDATSLYFVLQTLDAFTPASGQSFRVKTAIERR
jgi:hypothetical protein